MAAASGRLALRQLLAGLLGGGEGFGFFAQGGALLDHIAFGVDQRPVPLGVLGPTPPVRRSLISSSALTAM